MAIFTTDALDTLLFIRDGYADARWNFADAVGTHVDTPGGLGNGVSLTYSFLESLPAYASYELNFQPMDAAMQAAAESVLAHVAELVDIDFTRVADQDGQIRFGAADQSGSSAWAYPPAFFTTVDDRGIITDATQVPITGSVWFNNIVGWSAEQFEPGAFGYSLMLHEVGHALGLKHPFTSSREDGYILDWSIDHEGYTVMSYTHAPRTAVLKAVGGDGGWALEYISPDTMMLLDIQALQHLYGANTDTRAADTVYAWDTNEEMLETLWDGGGTDTLDCSNQVFTCRIDLRDGQFSSIGLRRTDAELKEGFGLPAAFSFDELHPSVLPTLYDGRNNLAIAVDAVIENASGGSGNDVIIGNDAANRLLGGSGQDRLSGGRSHDVLDGGRGLDRMAGGGGRDLFDFNRIADTGKTLATADVIAAFVSGVDRIDLSTIDARAARIGNQAFSFIGDAEFSSRNATGQVRFESGVLYASTDADMAAELVIRLPGVSVVTAADLLL